MKVLPLLLVLLVGSGCWFGRCCLGSLCEWLQCAVEMVHTAATVCQRWREWKVRLVDEMPVQLIVSVVMSLSDSDLSYKFLLLPIEFAFKYILFRIWASVIFISMCLFGHFWDNHFDRLKSNIGRLWMADFLPQDHRWTIRWGFMIIIMFRFSMVGSDYELNLNFPALREEIWSQGPWIVSLGLWITRSVS